MGGETRDELEEAVDAASGDAGVARDHWQTLSTRWALLGPPLRPSPEDTAIAARIVAAKAASKRPLRVLILGVTPELATLPWPAGIELRAVDRAASMVAAVWPRADVPRDATAIVGDWRALPFADGAFDLVLGDGVLAPLTFPDDARRMMRQARRVLAADGAFVLRSFLAPDVRESLDAVARDLSAGAIPSVHVLKWRLAMALQPNATDGHDDL